jgi:transposase-like protein
MSWPMWCPKCGSYNISGPRFTVGPHGEESLRYVCCGCGYTADIPTLEQKKEAESRAVAGTPPQEKP